MTGILIADDEDAPREHLAESLAEAWPEASLVARANNGAEAWDQWLAHEPQVCFLDVRMPGMSGLEVAEKIAGRSAIVFVTAFGDHALDAFQAGAVDYLLKPVDGQRLARTVERLRARLSQPGGDDAGELQSILRRLLDAESRRPWVQSIQASVGKEIRIIPVRDVLYFESDSRYTRVVYLEDGLQRDALLRTALKELLVQLDPRDFTQVHRSVIAATQRIAAAIRQEDGTMRLRLRGTQDLIAVSRPFQHLFKGQ